MMDHKAPRPAPPAADQEPLQIMTLDIPQEISGCQTPPPPPPGQMSPVDCEHTYCFGEVTGTKWGDYSGDKMK